MYSLYLKQAKKSLNWIVHVSNVFSNLVLNGHIFEIIIFTFKFG